VTKAAGALVVALALASVLEAADGHGHSQAGKPEELGHVDFAISCSPRAQAQFQQAVAMLHSFWYERTEAAFYTDPDTRDHRSRALAYEHAMGALHARFPQDDEVSAFYALALLATAPLADKTYANQLEAAAILEPIFRQHPQHPGAAHYIIHAFDVPALAPRALDAARSYARIAPSAPHALHMPSHIFTRLGLWPESIASNLASEAAARRFAEESHMGGAWDEQLHAMDYLEYAYLQRGQDEKAKGVLDEMRAIKSYAQHNWKTGYAVAAIPARYAVERRQWTEAAALPDPPVAVPWSQAIVEFARGYGRARLGDATGASADLEDSSDKLPVTPGPVVPAREMFGEMLLETNRPAEALRAFRAALRDSPDRFGGLAGAALAASLSGNVADAQGYAARLDAVTADGDGTRTMQAETRKLLEPASAR
jgi:hypothetical protein